MNLDVGLAALGLALSMITWGLDKLWGEGHPNLKKVVGVAYIGAGIFWFYVMYVAFTV
jgi:hypothetical protein